MAKIVQPHKVKLICGLISGSETMFDAALEKLRRLYGPTDAISEVFDFSMTDYYEDEMGPNLLRKFAAFENLISPDELADIKCATNRIEEQFAAGGSDVARPVNIDPGYVTFSKLVLASMKDFSHRIYLGKGVYGEITLQYRVKTGWRTLEWTFPDYASGMYFEFLSAAREDLRRRHRD